MTEKKKKPVGRPRKKKSAIVPTRGKDKAKRRGVREKTYTDAEVFDIMHAWACGSSFEKLQEDFKIHRNTAYNWKKANNPKDWELYRKQIMKEGQEAAIHEVRNRYAATVKTQFEDAQALRQITRKTLNDIATQLIDPKGKITADRVLVRMLKDLAKSLVDIQKMQGNVFGLPTHRFSMESVSNPIADAMSGKEMDSLSEQEMVRQMMDIETNGSGG